MKASVVERATGGIPHMRGMQGERIHAFILEHGLRHVLELGFRHGVSTCYMAAALDEMGGGHVTTIDLLKARHEQPNIEQLLKQLGLDKYVSAIYEPTSYTWRLMRLLEEDATPRFDFCFIDGAHDWFVDGFAFFLVDRLLKPGGWILFDDLTWTYDTSGARGTSLVQSMPADERQTPQIKNVYELLVRTHPHYGEFLVDGEWAFAKKLQNGQGGNGVRKEVVIREVGLGSALMRLVRRLRETW